MLTALNTVNQTTCRPRYSIPESPNAGLGQTVAIVLLGLIAGSAGAIELTPSQVANRRCLQCHGQDHIAESSPSDRATMVITPRDAGQPDGPAERPELFVGPDALAGSIHADVACVSCHPTDEELPHAAELPPATCGTSCHTKAAGAFLHSAHAEAAARGADRAPTCATCHGGHDVLRSDQRESRTYPLNVISVCSECHQQHSGATPNGHNPRDFFQTYLDSVHGHAVSEHGMVVAANCVNCHGSHEVRTASDVQSQVHRRQIPKTCGQCHVGIAETYRTSIHGQRLSEDHPDAPVCTDCHAAHAITRAATPSFERDIVNECGECHDRTGVRSEDRSSLYSTYRRSYHGQVTALGSTRAARCSDCHGAHEIRPISEPASRLHVDHRIDVCRQCHTGARPAFAKFQAHADFRDGQRYPLLNAVWIYFIILMSFTFAFFGIHSILWFARSSIDRFRSGPPARFKAGTHAIKRFGRIDRVNHALVVITFFGLTLTGMPLLFSDQGWARVLASMLGGGESAGIIHRIFAIMLIGNFVLHVAGVVKRRRGGGQSWRQWCFGPHGMFPRWKDVQDCLGMFRWFIGRGQRPRFDHWTYWEKFDYWAEIVGTLVIGGSGLLLWFPEFFSAFLPGWIYNVATIIHGYEAMLAVGFIFTIHFFNAHLRLEKFPVDDVIFTGSVPEQELEHERGVEYDRLTQSGEIEAVRVEAAPPWQRPAAIVVGIVAMAIGITMVALIVLAGLKLI